MPVTISIGSGKGGTGKTMVMVNLALQLAKAGKKVCLVDLDLGGADAHIVLGLFQPKRTLTDFLTRKVDNLSDVIHTFYSFGGLQFIPGTGDTLQTANMSFQEKQRLLRGLTTIDTDVLLIDVGAGTSYHALDFFMYGDIQMCVALPDPTSIMDLYNFLTLATIRKVLGSFLSQSEIGMSLKSNQFSSLQEVFNMAEQTKPGARLEAQDSLRYFHPLLVINRDSAGGLVNKTKLQQMVKKYLGIEIPSLGEVPEDYRVDEALKAFLPVTELYPDSDAGKALALISRRLEKVVDLFSTRQSQLSSQETLAKAV